MLVSCINSVISAPTCPEDHYWDTGVEDCEHCRDICQNAQLQKTVEACQHSCPAYSKKLHDGAQKILEPSGDNKGVAGASSEPSQDELPIGAKVGIGVASCIAIVGIVIAVIVGKRRIIQNRRKPRSQTTSSQLTSKLVGFKRLILDDKDNKKLLCLVRAEGQLMRKMKIH
ncbi:hypothetical protein C0Q70_00098 [Pomacea canaliculata]|uniref:Uncharacterized protein n=2 Tax=Pomacea canaliculata TaxID=400727 RepID=A0A2T7PVP8_POMCA|nr:hypothetical protein C0Q70_00098 [Pomacea canaliculata]